MGAFMVAEAGMAGVVNSTRIMLRPIREQSTVSPLHSTVQ